MKNEFTIENLEEKKWIMAYYFATHRFGIKEMFQLWSAWWTDDFRHKGKKLMMYKYHVVYPYYLSAGRSPKIAEPYDSIFDELVLFVKGAKIRYSKDELRSARFSFADNRIPTRELQNRAQKMGLRIRKSIVDRYPYRLSGYEIVTTGTRLKIISGKGYSYTLEQVEQYISEREQTNNEH